MSDFNRYSSVSEMLSTLQWASLKKRRDIQSLYYSLQNYKWFNRCQLHFQGAWLKTLLLLDWGHNKRFINISSTVDSYKFSFFPRIIPQWNALPCEAVGAPTLEQFLRTVVQYRWSFRVPGLIASLLGWLATYHLHSYSLHYTIDIHYTIDSIYTYTIYDYTN